MRIGIDASAMLIAQKNGYENYATSLILTMSELDQTDLDGLEICLYFYAGNRLADPALLDDLLPRLRRFTCRVYRPRRGFGVALPLMAFADRLDWLHLPVHSWARRFPCRVLSTFHDACSKRLLMEGYMLEAIHRHEEIIQAQLKTSQAFIAVSDSTRRDMIDLYGVPAERIHVVHHGFDDQFKPDANAAKTVQQIYNLPPYILSVNALQTNKNYIRLLRAFAQLREQYGISQVLVVVGRDGWGSDAVRAEIERLNLGKFVRCLGFVPRDHLPGLYIGADLVVNASLCEGFGLPILEALACGAVVAASRVTSLPEIGGPAVSYFDPYDVEDIATVILRALLNSEERSALLAAMPQQLASFTWTHTARETVSVYRKLAVGNYVLIGTRCNE